MTFHTIVRIPGTLAPTVGPVSLSCSLGVGGVVLVGWGCVVWGCGVWCGGFCGYSRVVGLAWVMAV